MIALLPAISLLPTVSVAHPYSPPPGSGVLLIALLRKLPTLTGIGVDISPAALAVAQSNAVENNMASRCSFELGKFADRVGTCDLVLCNPPYHLVGKFDVGPSSKSRKADPVIALFGTGVDGYDAYRELRGGLESVRVGGWAVVEVPTEAAVEVLLAAIGEEWVVVERVLVANGKERGILRAIIVVREPSNS